MIEYPHIEGPSKAPRKLCIAFDKLDGSNIRFFWNKKRGFHKAGTRRQMVSEQTPFWNQAVKLFYETLAEPLTAILERQLTNERVTIFCEWLGDQSFAGRHGENDYTMRLVPFDVHLMKKGFLSPREFIDLLLDKVEIPPIIYQGNLSDQFIQDVRKGVYGVNEGVVCKGQIKPGKLWMTKIKTIAYQKKLKEHFQQDWQKYWE